MVSLTQLWIPILMSGVLVFIASSLIHMVFKWHNADYNALSNEDEVRAAVTRGNPAPGQYVIPHCADMKQMGSPEMTKKFTEGPVAMLVLKASGPPAMGAALGQWFAFVIAISFSAAYIASRTLAAGTDYLQVFRVVGAVTFLAYAAGSFPAAIWMGKPWGSAAKEMLDGLIFALLTAGTFGWLWPH